MPTSPENSHTFSAAWMDGRVLLSHNVCVTVAWLTGPVPAALPQRRRPVQLTTAVGEALESIV